MKKQIAYMDAYYKQKPTMSKEVYEAIKVLTKDLDEQPTTDATQPNLLQHKGGTNRLQSRKAIDLVKAIMNDGEPRNVRRCRAEVRKTFGKAYGETTIWVQLNQLYKKGALVRSNTRPTIYTKR